MHLSPSFISVHGDADDISEMMMILFSIAIKIKIEIKRLKEIKIKMTV